MSIKKLSYKDHSVWLTIRDMPVHGDDYKYPRHASHAVDLHNVKRHGIYVNSHIVSEAGKVMCVILWITHCMNDINTSGSA